MNKPTEQIEKLGKIIKDALVRVGMKENEVAETFLYLEAILYRAIARDIKAELEPDKHQKLHELITRHASTEQIVKLLGLTEESFWYLYVKKLENYVATLTKHEEKLRYQIGAQSHGGSL